MSEVMTPLCFISRTHTLWVTTDHVYTAVPTVFSVFSVSICFLPGFPCCLSLFLLLSLFSFDFRLLPPKEDRRICIPRSSRLLRRPRRILAPRALPQTRPICATRDVRSSFRVIHLIISFGCVFPGCSAIQTFVTPFACPNTLNLQK